MRRKLEDWERAEALSTPYSLTQINHFSPKTRIIIEFQSPREAEITTTIYEQSQLLSAELSDSALAVSVTPQGDINLTSEVKLAWHKGSLASKGVELDEYGRLSQNAVVCALPIFQGAMIHQFNPVYSRYHSGYGHKTKWKPAGLTAGGSQFWLPVERCPQGLGIGSRLLTRRLINVTNARSMIAAVIPGFPSSDTTLVWELLEGRVEHQLMLAACLNSLVFDCIVRARVAGGTGATALDIGRLKELPIPKALLSNIELVRCIADLNLCHWMFAPQWVQLYHKGFVFKPRFALMDCERLRFRCTIDAVLACLFCLDKRKFCEVLYDCDHPCKLVSNVSFARSLNPKGFWRVDKDKDPELRHTVLTLVAFHDLEEKIRECGGNRDKGIEAFLNQNNGEGWMLPETLRLVDYGLGHDERAKEHQPVASRLGPRFYDWQLTQNPEESWRECHLHARNLLGQNGYLNLLAEVLRDTVPGGWQDSLKYACDLNEKGKLLKVFTKAIGYLLPDVWRVRIDEARTILAERGITLDSADTVQMIVEALKRIPEEIRTKGIAAARWLLGDIDFNVALKSLLASELQGSDHSWHVIAREQLGGTGYRQLMDDLEAQNPEKVAESAVPYKASKGKTSQMKLFD